MKLNWLQLVKLVVPMALSAVPHGDLLAPIVSAGIEQAEAMPGATGATKLKAVQGLVNLGMAGINAARPGTIDVAAVQSVIASGISTAVQAANLLHKGTAPKS